MFWGVTLETGKRYSQTVEESYHLTMAALEPPQDNKKSPSKYVSVVVEHEQAEYTLCTLEPNRNLQVQLDLMFGEGEQVTYYLQGEGTVHLTGYLVSGVYDDYMDEELDEEDEESSEEEVGKSLNSKGGKRKNEALESPPEALGKKAKVDLKAEKLNDKVVSGKKPGREEKEQFDPKAKKESNLNAAKNKDSDESEDDSEDDEESEGNDTLGLIDNEAIEVDSDEDDDEDEEEDEESDLSDEMEVQKSPAKEKPKQVQQNQSNQKQKPNQQNQQKQQQNQQKSPQNQQNQQNRQKGQFNSGQKGGFGGQQNKGFQGQKGQWNQSGNKNQNQRGGPNQWQNKNQQNRQSGGPQNHSPNFNKGGKQTPNFKGNRQNFNQSPNSGQKASNKKPFNKKWNSDRK